MHATAVSARATRAATDVVPGKKKNRAEPLTAGKMLYQGSYDQSAIPHDCDQPRLDPGRAI